MSWSSQGLGQRSRSYVGRAGTSAIKPVINQCRLCGMFGRPRVNCKEQVVFAEIPEVVVGKQNGRSQLGFKVPPARPCRVQQVQSEVGDVDSDRLWAVEVG